MSRVADAVLRAGHGVAHPAESSQGDTEGIPAAWERHVVTPERLPQAASPPVAPDVVEDLPPLIVDPQVRHELAGLVDRLFLAAAGPLPHCVAFADAGGAASASFVTAVVAERLAAQTAAQVCALDIDFASPSLHLRFGAASSHGLADFLRGEATVADVTRHVRGNLSMIPAGAAGSEMPLSAPASRQRMAELLGSFEYILVSAPALRDGGAGTLWFADGAVLLVAADETRRDRARAMSDALQRAGTPVLGAVLTNRSYPIPASLYSRL